MQSPLALLASDGQGNPGYFATQPGGASYTDYVVRVEYKTMPGRLLFHKAGAEPQNARIIKVGATITMKIVSWTASRKGGQPLCPAVKEDSNWKLLYATRDPVAPIVMPDGITKVNSCSGVYTYARTSALGSSDSLQTGLPPAFSYSTTSASLDAEDFKDIGV